MNHLKQKSLYFNIKIYLWAYKKIIQPLNGLIRWHGSNFYFNVRHLQILSGLIIIFALSLFILLVK